MNSDTRFNNLPDDMLIEIMLDMDYRSLKQLCRTNKRINKICRNETFWRDKYIQDFQKDKLILSSWYRQYKLEYSRSHPQTIYLLVSEYQRPIIQMVTSNLNDFLDLIVLIFNTKTPNEQMSDTHPLNVIFSENPSTAEIKQSILHVIYDLTDVYDNRVTKYRIEANDITNRFIAQKFNYYNSKFLKPERFIKFLYTYYLNPELLLFNEQYRSKEERELILEFLNFVYESNLIPGRSSPIPTYDEIFSQDQILDRETIYKLFSKPNRYIFKRSVYFGNP